MRGVSKRLAVLSLLLLFAVNGVSAAPRDDDGKRQPGWGSRIIHIVVKVLDQLGVPKP
jgi:hypothetical protein